jgi:TfoX/Sxy family transcriptional regulator of competence genes
MADDRWEELAADAEGGDVSRGSMFGSPGLRTGRKFFAISWHDQLVVKLPADRRQELVAAGRAAQFEPMAGRPMNGWLVLDEEADWPGLVEEARTHVEAQQK